jgi:hypothetical protein
MNQNNQKSDQPSPSVKGEKPLAYTRHQAAALLSISVVSIDRLIARGRLKVCRALRRPLIPASELDRLLQT